MDPGGDRRGEARHGSWWVNRGRHRTFAYPSLANRYPMQAPNSSSSTTRLSVRPDGNL